MRAGGAVSRAAARLLVSLLRIYRITLSPVLGPACRFEPSCSRYAEEAIRSFGPVRGAGLAAWRLLRCHPFARAGLDPVPERRPAALPRSA